ncbi:short-chain dehydrogenase [Penicillium malachiteum]|nr:short-chain dehydrogenase [Penicillium malachiteum]
MATSHPEFDKHTTGTEVAEAFAGEIQGKNVIITGVGPNSLGEALAMAIGSQQPAKLFLASRTEAKVQQVADEVGKLYPEVSIESVALDLASQKSIHAAAAHIQGLTDHIDILINNAGGKEVPLDERPPDRVPAMFNMDAPGYNGWIGYGQSKTANILFAMYLSHNLAKDGIVSYGVHPGSIETGLSRSLDDNGNEVISKTNDFWKTADQGAAGMLVAAFDPNLNSVSEPSAVYLADCQFDELQPHATSLDVAERLFHLSEELVGMEFPL